MQPSRSDRERRPHSNFRVALAFPRKLCAVAGRGGQGRGGAQCQQRQGVRCALRPEAVGGVATTSEPPRPRPAPPHTTFAPIPRSPCAQMVAISGKGEPRKARRGEAGAPRASQRTALGRSATVRHSAAQGCNANTGRSPRGRATLPPRCHAPPGGTEHRAAAIAAVGEARRGPRPSGCRTASVASQTRQMAEAMPRPTWDDQCRNHLSPRPSQPLIRSAQPGPFRPSRPTGPLPYRRGSFKEHGGGGGSGRGLEGATAADSSSTIVTRHHSAAAAGSGSSRGAHGWKGLGLRANTMPVRKTNNTHTLPTD